MWCVDSTLYMMRCVGAISCSQRLCGCVLVPFVATIVCGTSLVNVGSCYTVVVFVS